MRKCAVEGESAVGAHVREGAQVKLARLRWCAEDAEMRGCALLNCVRWRSVQRIKCASVRG